MTRHHDPPGARTPDMSAMAGRLARFLHCHDASDPAAVELMGDRQWERISDLAGEQRVPSPATRAATVVLLRAINAREAIR